MAKVESCIICKQPARNNNVIIVDNIDSDGYSLNDCEKSSGSDDHNDDDHDDDDDDDDEIVCCLAFQYFYSSICPILKLNLGDMSGEPDAGHKNPCLLLF